MQVEGSFPFGQETKDQKSLLQRLRDLFAVFTTVVNGNLGFGDGVDPDNIAGQWITYTSNAAPNTEDLIAHTLGVVPLGVLVVTKDKAAHWYKGSTAWSTSAISLKWDVASVTATLFILAPSNVPS